MDEAFSTRLRDATIGLMTCPTCHKPWWTMQQVSDASGIPATTLRRFLHGRPARLQTVDQLLVFLRKNGVVVKP